MVLLAVTSTTQAQLRVVTYNVAHLRGELSSLHGVFAALADDDRPGFAVAPQVYVFQEVHSGDVDTLELLLDAASPPGTGYELATYTNFGEDGASGAQALFYRTDALVELGDAHTDIYTGAGRRTDRWKLRLSGYDSPDASFYVYGAHLKAGSSDGDEQQRLDGVDAIRADAATLPAASHVIFAGDFNLQGNFEPAYAAFISPGAAQAFDPLGFGSWAGPGNADRHTQSPRLASLNELVGGGMDDRFDFQLVSAAMIDAAGLSIIPGTYRPLGNDGQHYNDDINDGNNFYYPDDLPRSNALADLLHDASDHLPVVVDYQVPAVLAATASSDLGRMIQGAIVHLDVEVGNAAGVVTPLGAAPVAYTVIGDGSVVGSCSGVATALAGSQPCSLALATSEAGTLAGSAVVFSNDQGVQNDVITLPVTAVVLRPSVASFSADDVVTLTSFHIDLAAGASPQALDVPVHDLGFDELQARLDVDTVQGLVAPVSLAGPLPTGIGGSPGVVRLSIDPSTTPPGVHGLTLTLGVSDEDVPGQTASSLEVHLVVTIEDETACTADATGDGAVDVDDLVDVILRWGPCPDCGADVDGSGVVDVDDLVQVILEWGCR